MIIFFVMPLYFLSLTSTIVLASAFMMGSTVWSASFCCSTCGAKLFVISVGHVPPYPMESAPLFAHTIYAYSNCYARFNSRVSTPPGKSWIFFLKIPGSGKSWKNMNHFSCGSNGTLAAIMYHPMCVDNCFNKCSVDS